MSAKIAASKGTPGDQIFTKVSVLVFLGVFLMGLGAQLDLWTSLYRAFFVWLVVSLMGGAIRVLWKYHLYQSREQELHSNLNRARDAESRLLLERRQRRDQIGELMDVMGERGRTATPSAPAAEAQATEQDAHN